MIPPLEIQRNNFAFNMLKHHLPHRDGEIVGGVVFNWADSVSPTKGKCCWKVMGRELLWRRTKKVDNHFFKSY